MYNSHFKGTGVALVTPFNESGHIDYPALEKVVQHVSDGGVNYLVALGTTAETPVLSGDEKKQVVKTILRINDGKLPVVLGKGGNHTLELINDLKSTDYEGIDAILSVTPWYNKPNQEGIYQHFAHVAEASPVPVILYNVPGRTSSNISASTCLRLARDFAGKIIGIKEASGDLKQIMEIISGKPKDFQVLSGDDGITLAMIALGGSGVISVIANAFPTEFSTMVNHALNGKIEDARKIHYPLLPIIDAMFAEGNPAGVKAFMKLQNLLDDNVRLPLVKVSEILSEKITKLHEELEIIS
ncbi:MAG: 4-hydroxy-tetrahydrodipicolinate synthase [Bacteroidales bacterium]|nr:4-hydroxy-tetrahydrodipicolinate synthase [Bacteroidales bacterium]